MRHMGPESVVNTLVMDAEPLVSIVLGSFNRRRFLKATIDSVRSDSVEVPHEIIVVDGGSTDGSIGWLVRQKDIVTIVQHNRGVWCGKPIERRSWGYFMNLGFKAAQGKYILMVSDDCLLIPGSIRAGIDQFEQLNSEGHRIGGVAFYWRNWPDEELYKIHRTYGKRIAINHGLFLREALEAVGYIDEDNYQFYCADGDLCLKIWEAGYEIVDCPRAFVEHHAHAPMRATHSSRQQYREDLATSRERWRHLLQDSDPFVSDWPTISYLDPHATVLGFPKPGFGDKFKATCRRIVRGARSRLSSCTKFFLPFRTNARRSKPLTKEE